MAGAFTVPSRAVRAGLGLALALLAGGLPQAAAHNPAVPLGVLSAGPALGLCDEAAGGELPLLIRTNIGFARAQTDGTYAFGCPTLWSASEGGATLSARAASGLLGVIGNQRLSLSTDGACSFTELPATGGRQAFDVAAGTDAIWFLERGGADPAESRLGRATDCTDSRIAGPWTDTLPDTVREGACGSDRCLFVSGARPTPSLWFAPVTALSAAMEQGAATDALWQQIPLPADLAPQRLAVRAASGGLLWVAITYDGGRDLLRFHQGADGAFAFVQRDPAVVFGASASDELLGPVTAQGAWVAAAGTQLWLLPQGTDPARPWLSIAEAQLSCLDAINDTLFVCNNYYDVARLDLPQPGQPLTLHRVFAVDLLQGPDTSCLPDDQAAACEADWIHLGGENALPVLPARTCAYGRPPISEPPAQPETRDPGLLASTCAPEQTLSTQPGYGCAVATGTGSLLGPLLLLLLRRRRRTA
jgi:hypothetical protein